MRLLHKYFLQIYYKKMENINNQITDIYTRIHAIESAVGLANMLGGGKKTSKKGSKKAAKKSSKKSASKKGSKKSASKKSASKKSMVGGGSCDTHKKKGSKKPKKSSKKGSKKPKKNSKKGSKKTKKSA